MAQAIAMTGAIIEEQNGSTMKYLKRCNYCGDVPNSSTTSSIPSIGNIFTSTFHCSKCGKNTELKIKGA